MSMREKIAKALAAQYWDRMFRSDAEIARLTYPAGKEAFLDERWWLYASDADAVLDVLMEPTEGMREMGDHAYNLTGICGSLAPSTSYEHTEFIWQAMIQAAKEGK